jgi:hypothetical protein
MNLILQFIINNVKYLYVTILSFFGILLIKKNNNLEKENLILKEDNKKKSKVLEVQNEVIQITNNTKDATIVDIADRMRKGKF